MPVRFTASAPRT